MSFQLSDEDSTDSESGIRFKTVSTRKPEVNISYRRTTDLPSKRKTNEDRYHDAKRSHSSWLDRRHSERPRNRSKDRLSDRSTDRSSGRSRERSYSVEDRHSKDKHRESHSREKKKQRSDSRERRKHHKSRRKEEKHRSSEEFRYKEEETSRKHIDEDRYKHTDDKNLEISDRSSRYWESSKKYSDSPKKYLTVNTSIEISDSDTSDHEKIDTIEKNIVNKIDHVAVSPTKQNKKEKLDSCEQSEKMSDRVSQKEETHHNINKKQCSDEKDSVSQRKKSKKEGILEEKRKSDGKIDSASFGPTLPTHLQKKVNKTNEELAPQISDNSQEENIFGPSLPPHLHKNVNKKLASEESVSLQPSKRDTFGPSIPLHLKRNIEESDNEENIGPEPFKKSSSSKNDSFEPTLSPHLQKIQDSESDSEENIGPKLPPKGSDIKIDSCGSSSQNILIVESDNKNNVGAQLPIKKLVIEENNSFGPALPPHLQNKQSTNEDASSFGPALPPHLQKRTTDKEESVIGPSIPTHLREMLKNVDYTQEQLRNSDSDDDMIGPVPEGHSSNLSHKLLEERALEMRLKALNPSDSKQIVREEWMTELPAVKSITSLGVTARQFRSKQGPDMSDRSSWTDTPQDKEKKKQGKKVELDIKRQAELEHIAKRDEEQAEIVNKHKKKKKRDKALIDLHQEKLKKKEKESDKPKERRPFDRDIDLKVNRFDEAQKKAILKKAQLLDNRFSSGESKFL